MVSLMFQFLFNVAVNTKQLLFDNVQSFPELFEISDYGQILCTGDKVLFRADLEYHLFLLALLHYLYSNQL